MSFGVSIGDILKLCELAGRVYKNCRDCTGEYQSMTSEARNLTNLLEDIGDKYDKIPENKQQQLTDAYGTCIGVLDELDKILVHYNGLDSKSKRVWDRLKWDQDKPRSIRERLTASVVMLSSFYTSLIHDNQVLILEALKRLEHDYRGGHREESIASVEMIASGAEQDEAENADDPAWPQIIRDLEDVGISKQIALSHREFIVGWFVRAVNEGRLVDQQVESSCLSSIPQDLGSALPVLPSAVSRTTPHNDLIASPLNEHITGTVTSQDRSEWTGPVSPVGRNDNVIGTSFSLDAPLPSISRALGSSTDEYHGSVAIDYADVSSDGTPSTATPEPPMSPFPEDSVPLTEGDIMRRAQDVMTAWSRRDFLTAQQHLEFLLDAVECGRTVTTLNRGIQPDRRVLRHLLGVCSSYTGHYHEAKRLFESVFNGIYLNGPNLDDGDIAAARWLGDVCLHLHEPQNAALAWGVAYTGLKSRYGISRELTRRVYDELCLLEHCLHSLADAEKQFQRHPDSLDIFKNSHAMEKATVITSVRNRMQMSQMHVSRDLAYLLDNGPTSQRPRAEQTVSKSVLVEPLASISTWPLQWDSTFLPAGAILLQQRMSAPPSRDTRLSSIGLGKSKSLHYVTKKSSKWMIDTVTAGLRAHGVEYREQDLSIVCRLTQNNGSLAYSIGVEIKFMKSRFSNMHGVLVTEAQ